MTDTPTQRVRAACEQLLSQGHDVTFNAVAAASGISRATCYRDRDLRTIIDAYRTRHGELITITNLADRIDNLTQTVEALATKVRHHEEQIRTLKRGRTSRPTPPSDPD